MNFPYITRIIIEIFATYILIHNHIIGFAMFLHYIQNIFNNISDPIIYVYKIASIYLLYLIIHCLGKALHGQPEKRIIALTQKIIQSTKIL